MQEASPGHGFENWLRIINDNYLAWITVWMINQDKRFRRKRLFRGKDDIHFEYKTTQW